MNSEPNVVSIAAWSARRAPGERPDLAIVPRDGRCRYLGERTPGPVRSAVKSGDHTLQSNAGRIVQFQSRGIGTSRRDRADMPTRPTSGTAV